MREPERKINKEKSDRKRQKDFEKVMKACKVGSLTLKIKLDRFKNFGLLRTS